MGKKTIIVVGAGKGMGNHIAEEFGRKGFQVALIARNQKSLDEYVRDFSAKGIEAYGMAADAENPDSLTRAFQRIFDKFGQVDVLVYNACVLEGGAPSALTNADLMRHYQVDVASALHCVHRVLPGMKERKNGTILFTGGGLALYPMPEFACVSIGKAALRALAVTLNTELKDTGIFTGIVTIMGNIAPGTEYDPADIAKVYWRHYTERKDVEIIFKGDSELSATQKAMNRYIQGLNSNNPEEIGNLFAENGYFSDGATRLIGLPDGNGTGPKNVAKIFAGIMAKFHVSVNMLKMNNQSMEYDVHLGDEIVLPCVGTATVNAQGKITEYFARPR